MKAYSKSKFTFPVGYHDFHRDQLFNFQLNRWHSLGYLHLEDMQDIGRRVKNFDDWKAVMTELAEQAVSEARLMEAAFFYRAAEFYTFQKDPDKEGLYDKFIDLFYRAFRNDEIERLNVPYRDALLPAIRIPPDSGTPRGIIVMHGGFDSFIEEFYSWMRYFAERGYEVIAFEGPGQGGARRKNGLALDPEWEKPAKAVLDHLGLDDVTWLGVSMGGYLCFRAAAFEPRIKRVIASGIAYDYTKFPNAVARLLMGLFFTYFRSFTNKMTVKKMQRDGMHTWSIGNLMYIADKKTPMEAADVAFKMNAENLHSELVKQDVLILTGREDHFIPFKMHGMQVKALTHARSVTARVFTKEEHAQNHCQIGNIGLALDVMVDWIGRVSATGKDMSVG
jgi:pimeloyl-ACP methyl ester carboxylesterase